MGRIISLALSLHVVKTLSFGSPGIKAQRRKLTRLVQGHGSRPKVYINSKAKQKETKKTTHSFQTPCPAQDPWATPTWGAALRALQGSPGQPARGSLHLTWTPGSPPLTGTAGPSLRVLSSFRRDVCQRERGPEHVQGVFIPAGASGPAPHAQPGRPAEGSRWMLSLDWTGSSY